MKTVIKTMATALFISVLIISASQALAALSPSSAKLRDLNTMIRFIEQHPKVAGTLHSIDFLNTRIIFDDSCEAFFVRAKARI